MEELNGSTQSSFGESPPVDTQPLASAAIDDKSGSDHQEGKVVHDSKALIQENVPDSPPLEQNTPSSDISNELGTTVEDPAVVSSEELYNGIVEPHSLVTSNEELVHIAPHQLEDGASAIAADDHTNNVRTSASGPEGGSFVLDEELNHCQVDVGSMQTKTPESAADPSEHVKQVNVNRGLVDTAAPFESVKEAVNMFGGIVDWKAYKAQTLQRRKHVEEEIVKVQEEIPQYKKKSEAAEDAKVQVLRELDSTKRLIEELKLSLERAQTEELQAKQDSELAQLRAKEMEQGIADEVSVAAKTQLEVAKSRHEAAVADLKSVKEELESLRVEHASLVDERDAAIQKAEEAVSRSKEIEKTVEDLTLELITAKESLESSHAAHLEAEEHRIGSALAREQDCLNWEKELKEAEEEVRRLDAQILLARDLQSKLDSAASLLFNLRGELAAYMESRLNQESEAVDSSKSELEKAKAEVGYLSEAARSLKYEVEREKTALATMRQREGIASVAVSSLEADINQTKRDIETVSAKEKEARKKSEELPKQLQRAAEKADRPKALACSSREELRSAVDSAERAKAGASTMEIRLRAALKEIETARASEKLALAAVRALQESDSSSGSSGVLLPLEEYYALSKRAHEAEELANERVSAAVSEIEAAKERESRSLEALGDAYREMKEKKEALRAAMQRAEEAKAGKLGVEQELRKWRAEQEQQRRASEAAAASRSFEDHGKTNESFDDNRGFNNIADAAPHVVIKERRKKSFFPRILMFLAREKAQPLK